MVITKARRIADLVNNGKFKGFDPEINAAFHTLHKSAERGNKEDRKLAKMLWDFIGSAN